MFDYESYDAISDYQIAVTINNAMHIKPESIEFLRGKKSAYMESSRQAGYAYHVTLSSCECGSFVNTNAKKVPCKHMFRLAYELGYNLNFPELNPYANYDPASDLEVLHQRWANREITFDAYKACKAALEKSARDAKRARRGK